MNDLKIEPTKVEHVKLQRDGLDPLYIEILSKENLENAAAYSILFKEFAGNLGDYFNGIGSSNGHKDLRIEFISHSEYDKIKFIDLAEFEKQLRLSIEETANHIAEKTKLQPDIPFTFTNKFNAKVKKNMDLRKELTEKLLEKE